MSFIEDYRNKNPAERLGLLTIQKWIAKCKNPTRRRELEQAIQYQTKDEQFGKEYQSIENNPKSQLKPDIDIFINKLIQEMINNKWSLREIEKFGKKFPKSKSSIERRISGTVK